MHIHECRSNVYTVLPFMPYSVVLPIASEMDLCLPDYGHCNFVSSHHACIFFDKVLNDMFSIYTQRNFEITFNIPNLGNARVRIDQLQ